MEKKMGSKTYHLPSCPSVLSYGSAVGVKEGKGPLGGRFDQIFEDTLAGEKSWEKAESALQKAALNHALVKGNLSMGALDYLLAGDLLNQCISSGYTARDLALPFFGLYGACSTMAESLALGSMLLDGGFGHVAAAMTSSHFCSAERQYRSPLEYGSQRTPTAQWTATASGAVILGNDGPGPYVTHVTIGTIQDHSVKDANNMGAAMAPGAYDTLCAHFSDTGRTPEDYDLILTGDLGQLGHDLVLSLAERDGNTLDDRFQDCGVLLYDVEGQDVHCGGSGCGCSAAVLTGMVLDEMRAGTWKRVLFCGTGALHSPTSLGQGESIPGICHAVALSCQKE
ncbi:MAG: stage V sporulation protein AD [Oscillospiraceae bacterium]|nr:stage V sporulation protein AD [Oscillospiraceae bacterium]